MGYVFISVPSGYKVAHKGVLPNHYLDIKSKKTENADFELLPMADHLNRGASADRVALEMLTSYKRKLLDRALDELCEELTGASGLSTSTKPAKGGERHGNSSKTRR